MQYIKSQTAIVKSWTERVFGEITFSTAARQASIVFAISLFLGLCGWSPSFAQQADGNWIEAGDILLKIPPPPK